MLLGWDARCIPDALLGQHGYRCVAGEEGAWGKVKGMLAPSWSRASGESGHPPDCGVVRALVEREIASGELLEGWEPFQPQFCQEWKVQVLKVLPIISGCSSFSESSLGPRLIFVLPSFFLYLDYYDHIFNRSLPFTCFLNPTSSFQSPLSICVFPLSLFSLSYCVFPS